MKLQHLYQIARRTIPNELASATRQSRQTATAKTAKTTANKDTMLQQHPSFQLGKIILQAGQLIRQNVSSSCALGHFLKPEQIVPDHEQDELEAAIEEQQVRCYCSSTLAFTVFASLYC